MTADEMFRELGYEADEVTTTECGYPYYEHKEEPMSITIEDDGVWFEDDAWRYKVGIREIRAVAKLLDEMEAAT